MIGWYIFASLILVIWLIGMTSATIVLRYNQNEGIMVSYVRVLFLKFNIISPKENPPATPLSARKLQKIRKKQLLKQIRADQKKKRKLQKKKKKSVKKDKPVAEQKKKGAKDYLSLLDEFSDALFKLLSTFSGHIKIKTARLLITVATPDAAKTAMLYGLVSQSLAYVTELLRNYTDYKPSVRDNIGVYADFCKEKTVLDLDIKMRIRVWHLFDSLIKGIGTYISTKIKNKASSIATDANGFNLNKSNSEVKNERK